MVEPMLFEPEIEGLLREIASDPRSTLLRVDRPAVVRGLFDRGLPIRAHATGLTSTERHLLHVHRAELAFMLRQACVSKLYAHPEAKFRLIRHVAPGVRVEAPPPSHWRRNLGHELRIARADGIELDGIELLQSCVSADAFGRATVGQLAAASMRLVPTDQARIYSAVASMFDGDDGTAVDVLHGVIDGTSSRRVSACAWTEIGDAYNNSGRVEDALAAFERAIELDPYWIAGALSLLVVAACRGDRRRAEHAAINIRSLAASVEDGAFDFGALLREQCARGRFVSSRAMRNRIASMAAITGDRARVIADALM